MVSNKPHSLIPWSNYPSLSLNPAFDLSALNTVATSAPNVDRGNASMISRTLQKNRFARPSWTKSTSSSASSSSSNAEAAVIATDPLETSQLYRSEMLWTDFEISSASIRVAFRYVFHDAGSEVDPNNNDDGGAKSKGKKK